MKIRPVDEQIHVWDGYRGDLTIGWQLEGKGRGVEVFGTWCPRCMTSWGWTLDPAKAATLHKAMKKLGCPRCPKEK